MEWLFYLGVILLAAKLGAEATQRLGISAVIGEIAVGVMLGHSLLNIIPESELVEALAEMGVLFMIFLLGLETKVAHVLEVGVTALLVALGGIVPPLCLGLSDRLVGRPDLENLALSRSSADSYQRGHLCSRISGCRVRPLTPDPDYFGCGGDRRHRGPDGVDAGPGADRTFTRTY